MPARTVEPLAAFVTHGPDPLDRQWARWVQRKVESFRMPKHLVKHQGLPSRLGRVLRDEDLPSVASESNEELDRALRASRGLIVVCSRKTPESKRVNSIVQRFCELGRGDRIFALLVDGETGSSFPAALRSQVRPEVRIEERRASEPLAADVRPGNSARRAVRHRRAELRLIAGLVGCAFDELARRDRSRRIRRRIGYGAALVVAVGILAVLAGRAVTQSGIAAEGAEAVKQKQTEVQAQQTTLLEDRGRQALHAGDPARAVEQFLAAMEAGRDSDSLRLMLAHAVLLMERKSSRPPGDGESSSPSPSDPKAADLVWEPGTRPGAAPADVVVHPSLKGEAVYGREAVHLAFDEDGRRLLFASGGLVRRWDVRTGAIEVDRLQENESVHRIARGTERLLVRRDESLELMATDSGERLGGPWGGEPPYRNGLSGITFDVRDARDQSRVSFVTDGTRVVSLRPPMMVYDSKGGGRILEIPNESWFKPLREQRESAERELQDAHIARNTAEVRVLQLMRTGRKGADSEIARAREELDKAEKRILRATEARMEAMVASDRTQNAAMGMELAPGAFSPDGTRAVVQSKDLGPPSIRDVETGEVKAELEGEVAGIAFFTPDGSRVVSYAPSSRSVAQWDALTGKRLGEAKLEGEIKPEEGQLSPGGEFLFIGEHEAGWLFDLRTGKARELPNQGKLGAFDPRGGRLVTLGLQQAGHGDGIEAVLWDAGTGAKRDTWRLPYWPLAVAFHPGRDVIAVADPFGVRLLGLSREETGLPLLDGQGMVGENAKRCLSADGRLVALGGHDGAVRVWEPATGKRVCSTGGHNGAVDALAFDPTGTRLASAGTGEGAIWDVATGERRGRLLGHAARITNIAYSPDGSLLATASEEGGVRVWSRDGAPVAVLGGTKGAVAGVAFHPNGAWLVAGSDDDGSIRIWDTRSAALLVRVVGSPSCPATFTPDGLGLLLEDDKGQFTTARLPGLSGSGTDVVKSVRARVAELAAGSAKDR